MKKFLTTFLAIIAFLPTYADGFSFGINGSTTNYLLGLVGLGVDCVTFNLLRNDDGSIPIKSVHFVPIIDAKFPIAINNSTNQNIGKMYLPYKKCFNWPWKELGDYNIGFDASYDIPTTPFGFYTGCDYKSVQVITDNLDSRTHYVSPELGLRLKYNIGSDDDGLLIEIGGSYDFPFSYKGDFDNDMSAINGGFCAAASIGYFNRKSYNSL